jgi:glutathione S-transferase
MLKIWGHLKSFHVRKAVLAAQEVGVAFERTDLGGSFGGNKAPEYLVKNPNGLIPVIEDDQVLLWESNVIVRYLCARHAPDTLYPLALPKRFEAERWMDWQQTALFIAARTAFIQLIRTPAEKRDASIVAQSIAATDPLLAMLDQHLARQPFMAGDAITMADLPLAVEIHRWYNLPIERPARPNLERWFAGMSARPSARGVLDVVLA